MRIFVITGAGVSAESGLGTFRDKDGTGIWARFDPMNLATPEAFARDPHEVYAFYNARRQNLIAAKPNVAHFALARLEMVLAERRGKLALVTQNVDDLHERAGSKRVTHMHGELLKARCAACEAVIPWCEDLGLRDQCSACERTGTLRPHRLVRRDATSGRRDLRRPERRRPFRGYRHICSVYPAAGFVYEARALGIRTCEINLEPSDNADQFDERRYGLASEAIYAWVDEVLTLK